MAAPRPGPVLVTGEALRARVAELGRQIAADYAGRDLVLVGVLRGALVFLADLIRAIPGDVTTDVVAAASYGTATESAGPVELLLDLAVPIEGRHVLVVEDIVDTGRTLARLLARLRARRPASLRVCVLLDKPARRAIPVALDYVGFTVPDVFVVGYGLDHGGRWRNLPEVAVLGGGPGPSAGRNIQI